MEEQKDMKRELQLLLAAILVMASLAACTEDKTVDADAVGIQSQAMEESEVLEGIGEGQEETAVEYVTIMGEQYRTDALELILKAKQGDEFTDEDLRSLAKLENLISLYLYTSNRDINLYYVSGLTNLETLYCEEQSGGNSTVYVSEGQDLSKMANLRSLTLNGYQIGDLSPLTTLPSLEHLALRDIQINSNLTSLGKMNNLSNLELVRCYPTGLGGFDLSPLGSLSNLTMLNISESRIEDLSPLNGLTNLWQLILNEIQINQVGDLSPGHLPDLTVTVLNMDGSQETLDLGTVETAGEYITIQGKQYSTDLEELVINEATNDDLLLLGKMANLKTLSLSSSFNDNSVSDLTPISSLNNLTALSVNCYKLSDISPLSGMTNLTTLELSGNEINDWTPISDLTNLKELRLFSGNPDKPIDLTLISNMANLTTLDITNDYFTNLTSISTMANLTELYLSNKSLKDLTPLKGLTGLTTLYLNCFNLTDLTPISKLTNLKTLELYNCGSVSDLTPISRLINLTELSMPACYKLSDLTPISNLTNLAILELPKNEAITDLTPLRNLTNLLEINIIDCYNISDQEIQNLKDALPNLMIHRY